MSVLTEKFSQVEFTIKKHSRVSTHLESESSKYVQTQRVKDIDKNWQASCKLNITRGIGKTTTAKTRSRNSVLGPWTVNRLLFTDYAFKSGSRFSQTGGSFPSQKTLLWRGTSLLRPCYVSGNPGANISQIVTDKHLARYVIIIRIYIMHAVIFL